MHEVFEHTADIGLRIRAATLPDLFREAAEGLFELIVPDLNTVRPQAGSAFQTAQPARRVRLSALRLAKRTALHVRHQAAGAGEVRRADNGRRTWKQRPAVNRSIASRHQLEHEVKAITYHGLKVVRDGDGWLAEVILDI